MIVAIISLLCLLSYIILLYLIIIHYHDQYIQYDIIMIQRWSRPVQDVAPVLYHVVSVSDPCQVWPGQSFASACKCSLASRQRRFHLAGYTPALQTLEHFGTIFHWSSTIFQLCKNRSGIRMCRFSKINSRINSRINRIEAKTRCQTVHSSSPGSFRMKNFAWRAAFCTAFRSAFRSVFRSALASTFVQTCKGRVKTSCVACAMAATTKATIQKQLLHLFGCRCMMNSMYMMYVYICVCVYLYNPEMIISNVHVNSYVYKYIYII